MITYIQNLNNIKIKYNHKKAKYPRLYNTKKRKINGSIEIINKINCYFISKLYWLEELCLCLKYKFTIKKLDGKNVLYTDNKEINDNIYFNSYILVN